MNGRKPEQVVVFFVMVAMVSGVSLVALACDPAPYYLSSVDTSNAPGCLTILSFGAENRPETFGFRVDNQCEESVVFRHLQCGEDCLEDFEVNAGENTLVPIADLEPFKSQVDHFQWTLGEDQGELQVESFFFPYEENPCKGWNQESGGTGADAGGTDDSSLK